VALAGATLSHRRNVLLLATPAEVVRFVRAVMAENFPGGPGTVPFHSRWRHFEPGGVDRVARVGVHACVPRRAQGGGLMMMAWVCLCAAEGRLGAVR
jgi:hypothetical protein